MKIRSDRGGGIGLQLAALVDLLFVITFLLIWERESLMHKRIAQVKASVKTAQVDVQKAEQSQRAALDALAQAEKERQKALEEVRRLGEQLDRITMDTSREKKLDRDLHEQFEWMLDGMRRGREGTLVLPPPVRFGTNVGGPGPSGNVAPANPDPAAGTIPAIPPPVVPAPVALEPVAPPIAPSAASLAAPSGAPAAASVAAPATAPSPGVR